MQLEFSVRPQLMPLKDPVGLAHNVHTDSSLRDIEICRVVKVTLGRVQKCNIKVLQLALNSFSCAKNKPNSFSCAKKLDRGFRVADSHDPIPAWFNLSGMK